MIIQHFFKLFNQYLIIDLLINGPDRLNFNNYK